MGVPRRLSSISAALLIVGTLAATGFARAGNGWKVLERQSGKRTAVVSSNVDGRRVVAVRVTSKPPRRFRLTWSVGCRTATLEITATYERVSGRTPSTRLIAYPSKRGRDCTARARATLYLPGTVTVALLEK